MSVLNFIYNIKTRYFIPWLSTIMVFTFIISNIVVHIDDGLTITRDSRHITFKQSVQQYFGMNTLHKSLKENDEYFVDKVLFWSSLIYVEAYHGHFITLLVVLLAYINFAATNYMRGTLTIFPCCSSYAFWTFLGASVTTLLFHICKKCVSNSLLRCFIVFIFCSAFVFCTWYAEEKNMWHHTFPCFTAIIFIFIMELHNESLYKRVTHPRISNSSINN